MESDQDTAKRSVLKRKSIRLLGLSAIALMVSVSVWALLSHEPVYQGRNLAAWLADFEDDQIERRVLASTAVKHIGVEAVPFLIQRLRYDPNTAKRDSRFLRWKRQALEWLNKYTFIKVSPARPANRRRQALAALDSLGPLATNALPALEKLLDEKPPDPQALYVVARIGPQGLPVLYRALTNSTSSEAKLLRLEAEVCFEMLKTHSAILFPRVESGPDASFFDRRICEFNSMILRAAAKDYRSRHPEIVLPAPLDMPAPSAPP